MSGIEFEDLGGIVPEADEVNMHVTVTVWAAAGYASLTIDGGDSNFANARLTGGECRRLKNILANAERRLT
jgi:hypothetical protein